MNFLRKSRYLFHALDKSFSRQTGFKIREITFEKVVNYLYAPKDPSSLAVSRILFGLAMMVDTAEERGGAIMDTRWGNPRTCHFPLIPVIKAMPMPYMAVVYACMWIGALGIMLGHKFRRSAIIFAVCYWYLFLIEKSFWNNHSYLFGLISILFIGTQANKCLSLDARTLPPSENRSVPYWNYFLLKYQFFILYFVAGLKKGTAEWLSGYSLPNLSDHWVFDPFKLLLTVSQTDYLIVHWFAFVFDLTIAFWMTWGRTRHLAMIFCAAFHLMNIRLFRIGMFPWVCLATMPLFYPCDWPKIVYQRIKEKAVALYDYVKDCMKLPKIASGHSEDVMRTCDHVDHPTTDLNKQDVTKNNMAADDSVAAITRVHDDDRSPPTRRKIVTCLIVMYMIIQAFLPYSHFITKGYNNWTNGMYGYSWDMMVHTWDTVSVVVKVVDNDNYRELYLNSQAMSPNDRWTRHGDMVYQYAHCIKDQLLSDHKNIRGWKSIEENARNISIYVDVLCSLNGRFQQHMFDPKVDLLTANWSPFKDVEWLMPLLVDAENWRNKLDEIQADVLSWNNYSDVVFLADFPGHSSENHITEDLFNVTLSILEGLVAFEPEVNNFIPGKTYIMPSRDHVHLLPGSSHKVHNIGYEPAYYMYTFSNMTVYKNVASGQEASPKEKLPIRKEFAGHYKSMFKFFKLIAKSLFQLFFRMPMSLIGD